MQLDMARRTPSRTMWEMCHPRHPPQRKTKIIPAKDPNRESLVFLAHTYVCVQGGSLARLASLGSLGTRVHCGYHVHIDVRVHVCVKEGGVAEFMVTFETSLESHLMCMV